MSSPTEQYWAAGKRILRYLKGTVHWGLHLQPAPPNTLLFSHAFCDADWASDPDDKRSTFGAAVFLGPNLVSGWSKKQPVVACCSTEAEYRSLAHTTAEVVWIQTLLSELQVQHSNCDNLSTVSLGHNLILHARTKHMELDLFFVLEKVASGQMKVLHVLALDQYADVLTKPLSPTRFSLLRSKLNVVNAQPIISPS